MFQLFVFAVIVWALFKFGGKLIKWVVIVLIAYIAYCCIFGKVSFGTSLFDKKVHQVQKHIGQNVNKAVDKTIGGWDISAMSEEAEKSVKSTAGSIIDSVNVDDMVPREVKW